MALGAVTVVRSWNDFGGHHLIVRFPLSAAANWTSAGEAIDLSTATLGIVDGFASAVQGGSFLGYAGAPSRRVTPRYNRAAAGATATGTITCHEEAAGAGAEALTPDNTDLSATTVDFEFIGN